MTRNLKKTKPKPLLRKQGAPWVREGNPRGLGGGDAALCSDGGGGRTDTPRTYPRTRVQGGAQPWGNPSQRGGSQQGRDPGSDVTLGFSKLSALGGVGEGNTWAAPGLLLPRNLQSP